MAPDTSATGDRDPAQIKAEIEATQARLAATVDQISERVAPKNVLARIQAALKGVVIDPVTGSPRTERLAAGGGVVVLLVLIRVVRWRRGRR